MRLPPSPRLTECLGANRVERLLVMRTDRLGDLLWTTPALRALRKRFAKARITVLTTPYAAPVLHGNPNVDEVLMLARDRRAPWRTRRRERALVRELVRRRFDLAVVFARGKGANVRLARRAGIPLVVGMARDLEGGYLPARPEHQAAEDLGVVAALGAGPESLDLDVAIDPEDAAWAARFLADGGWTPGAPLLGIHPGSGEFLRRPSRPRDRAALERRLWPVDRLAAFAAGFAERHRGRVLLTGTAAERPRVEPVLRSLGPAAIDAMGRTTVGRLAALINRADVYVSPDTGPMHLAAALGTPLVALFGYQDPAITGPVGGRGARIVLRHSFPCSPCHGWVKRSCSEAVCMRAITVDEVAVAVDALLGSRA